MAVSLVGTSGTLITTPYVADTQAGDILIAVTPNGTYPPVDTAWLELPNTSGTASRWEWKIAEAGEPAVFHASPTGVVGLRGSTGLVANSPVQHVTSMTTVTVPAVAYPGTTAYQLILWASAGDHRFVTPPGFAVLWIGGSADTYQWGFLGAPLTNSPAPAADLTVTAGGGSVSMDVTSAVLDMQTAGSLFVG